MNLITPETKVLLSAFSYFVIAKQGYNSWVGVYQGQTS